MCIAQNKLECSQLFDHNVQDSPGCTKGVERCTLDPWIIEKKETMVVYNDTSNRLSTDDEQWDFREENWLQ